MTLSISIGYFGDGDVRDVDELIREADAATYRDKSEKRKKDQKATAHRG